MHKTGFIGFGSMGSMLVQGFLSAGMIDAPEVIVSTRRPEQAAALRSRWPHVEVTDDNRTTARRCGRIFLCVKPMEVKPVLDEMQPGLRSDTHIISIAACVTIADIETVHRGKITKVIPSLTSEVREGISLLCHNAKVTREDAHCVERLFGSISTVQAVRETDFEAAADLTSCAPGLIAAIFQEFIEAGLRHSGLNREEAEDMVVKTLFGTAKLLKERGMRPEEAIARVATRGGITEEGVNVLRDGLPGVFDGVFRVTLGKHENRKSEIREQFRRD